MWYGDTNTQQYGVLLNQPRGSNLYTDLTTDPCTRERLSNCDTCGNGVQLGRPVYGVNQLALGGQVCGSGVCGCDPLSPCSGVCNNPCKCIGRNPCDRSTFFTVQGQRCRNIMEATDAIGKMFMSTRCVNISVTRNAVFDENDVIDTIVPVVIRPSTYPRSIEIAGMLYAPMNLHLDGLVLKNFCLVTSSDRAQSCKKVMITNSLITGNKTCIVNQGGKLELSGNTFDSEVVCRPVVDHVCGKTTICNNCGEVGLCSDSDTIPMFTYQRSGGMTHVNNTIMFIGDGDDSVAFGVAPGVDSAHHDMNSYYHTCKLTYHAVVDDMKDDNCCRDPCSKKIRSLPNTMVSGDSSIKTLQNVYRNVDCAEPEAVWHSGFKEVIDTNTTAYIRVITTGQIPYTTTGNKILLYNTSVFTSSNQPSMKLDITGTDMKVGLYNTSIDTKSVDYVIEFVGDGGSSVNLTGLDDIMTSDLTTPEAYTLTGIADASSILFDRASSLIGVVPYTGNSPNGVVGTQLDT